MQKISQKHIHFWNVWKFSNLCRKHEKPANFKEFQSFQRSVIIQANICRTWMKSTCRWSERLSCVVLDQLKALLGRVQFPFGFSTYLEPNNSTNFKKFSTFWNWCQKTFFSEACIFLNICRNFMKSWQRERSDSEVFEVA